MGRQPRSIQDVTKGIAPSAHTHPTVPPATLTELSSHQAGISPTPIPPVAASSIPFTPHMNWRRRLQSEKGGMPPEANSPRAGDRAAEGLEAEAGTESASLTRGSTAVSGHQARLRRPSPNVDGSLQPADSPAQPTEVHNRAMHSLSKMMSALKEYQDGQPNNKSKEVANNEEEEGEDEDEEDYTESEDYEEGTSYLQHSEVCCTWYSCASACATDQRMFQHTHQAAPLGADRGAPLEALGYMGSDYAGGQ